MTDLHPTKERGSEVCNVFVRYKHYAHYQPYAAELEVSDAYETVVELRAMPEVTWAYCDDPHPPGIIVTEERPE